MRHWLLSTRIQRLAGAFQLYLLFRALCLVKCFLGIYARVSCILRTCHSAIYCPERFPELNNIRKSSPKSRAKFGAIWCDGQFSPRPLLSGGYGMVGTLHLGRLKHCGRSRLEHSSFGPFFASLDFAILIRCRSLRPSLHSRVWLAGIWEPREAQGALRLNGTQCDMWRISLLGPALVFNSNSQDGSVDLYKTR